MIPHLIYLLCMATCLGCAFLLFRAFRKSRSRLLFWSSLHFLILGLSNLILVADLSIYPEVSFLAWRNACTLFAVVVLLFGLIFEAQ